MSIDSISTAAASSADAAKTTMADDFDDFLLILTAQLQNQDPLDPMDSSEFTNQLVMFSDLEQSIAQNSNLEDLVSLNKGNEAISAVGYIGKTIKADHNEFFVDGDGSAVELSYTFPEEGASGLLTIYDPDGKLVYQQAPILDQGEHDLTWNPQNADGANWPAGVYRFQVDAVNANDQPINNMSYSISGAVTAVEYSDTSTLLSMGQAKVDIGKVTAIKQ